MIKDQSPILPPSRPPIVFLKVRRKRLWDRLEHDTFWMWVDRVACGSASHDGQIFYVPIEAGSMV